MALLPPGVRIVVVHPPLPVKRSWRERLFSRPWRPGQTHRTPVSPRWEAVQRAGGGLYYDGTLFVGPAAYNELTKHTKAATFPDLARPI